MKLITDSDVLQVARNIGNYTYHDNLLATRELMELFDKIIKVERLNSWEDYVSIYDNNFYTYQTWNELVQSEIEQGEFGLNEEELTREFLDKDGCIWRLPCGWYVQRV